jgi:hypothetical protein
MGGKEIIMIKNTRYYNAAECMVWMYANNPGKVDIHMPEDYPRYLISLVPVTQLKFPEGWYYSEQAKTINNDLSGIKFNVVTKE